MNTAWWDGAVAIIGTHGLSGAELWGLFLHFMVLSMLAVGGAITTAPGMHGYLVTQHRWLSDAQFTSSVALAQAAPGPNVLFVAVLGWNTAGMLGMLATLLGSLLPSSTLAWAVARWGAANREHVGLRVFTNGLMPLTIGLLWSTGWLLTDPIRERVGTYVLVALTVVVMQRTRWSPMWLIAVGGLAGALGWV